LSCKGRRLTTLPRSLRGGATRSSNGAVCARKSTALCKSDYLPLAFRLQQTLHAVPTVSASVKDSSKVSAKKDDSAVVNVAAEAYHVRSSADPKVLSARWGAEEISRLQHH